MDRSRRRGRVLSVEWLDDRCLLSVLTPAQVRHAYGVDAVSFSSNGQSITGNGSGQTIAIVDAYHDPNLVNDLKTFDAANGLANPQISQIYSAGTATNAGWATEEALDVEWAHALAPGAKIVVVEAKSSSLTDLLSAVDTARNMAGVSVVSMSWGTSEFNGETSLDSHFTTPSGHNGVTFVASSGDSSAYAGAQWPAVSPNVLAVGGTNLQVDSSGNILSETAWYNGGGGYSALETRPGYQTGLGSSTRTVPDVSAVADPSTGVEVYSTNPSTGQGSWYQVGGTSASAPMWAAIVAVADQGRATAGLGTLDGASQTLPAIYQAPSSAFHDITSGSNGYSATAGYDLATGRGSPNAPVLIASLVGNSTQTTQVPTTTQPPTTTQSPTHHRSSWGGWGWYWGWGWNWYNYGWSGNSYGFDFDVVAESTSGGGNLYGGSVADEAEMLALTFLPTATMPASMPVAHAPMAQTPVTAVDLAIESLL